MKDYEQVKAVNSSLHPRAIRERHLSRSFAKHREKIERLFTDQGTSTGDVFTSYGLSDWPEFVFFHLRNHFIG